MSEDTNPIRDTANAIIKSLGEKSKNAHRQIYNVVKLCGVEFAQELLEDTQAIEAGEGMMTVDGKRRRTPGGVFLRLAKERITDEAIRAKLWPVRWNKEKRKLKKQQKKQAAADKSNTRTKQ